MYKNNEFINKFKSKDKRKVEVFFNRLDNAITLNKKDKRKIINDFEKFINYYYENNKNVSDILKLLPLSNIKNNYTSNEWYPLDNSSKVYPLSMGEEWMSIYRLSLYLKDDVNPIILQIALFYTMGRFPLFRTSIHKGFFWNYLDSTNKHFKIKEEKNIPCSLINISRHKNELFRVVYYKNRISCEFFHVLADAHGGMVFLVTLVNEYLRLLLKMVDYNEYALDSNNFSHEEIEDAFKKIKVHTKEGGLIENKALSIDGKISRVKPCQIIHIDLDYVKLHKLAKEKDVTINELLLGFLFVVLSYSTSKDGDIKIQVPVNMRKFYPSKTLRNFSLYNTISIKKKDINNLDSVIMEVKKQSREKLTKEKMDGVMYHALKLVKGVSGIPLFIKGPIAKFIYHHFGDKGSTTVLSNLGKIPLPNKMNDDIIGADFTLGTTLSNRVLFSVITINNTVTLTISKFTTNKSVENNLYSLFKEYDLINKIRGSEEYEIRK